MIRQEHITRCKKRAVEYAEQGNLILAFQSLVSDLRKHPETENHCAIQLGMSLLITGHLSTKEAMINFINGFQ